ncbi:MAG: ABC transporter ATP-binding protein, partial [Planctomycetota bacterium]
TKVIAVDGIDLSMSSGDVVAIVGASGSGKTTLMHLLGGLERSDSGSVSVAGHDLCSVSDAQLTRLRLQHIGVVFQNYNLMPTLSAVDNVALPLLLAGTAKKVAREHAKQRLDEVGLSDRFKHQPAQLSGGEQQRIALARSMVNDPEIVLADEPTGSLDRQNSIVVIELLRRVVASQNRAVAVVTHDPLVAARADRVLVMSDGVIADQFCAGDVGSVDELNNRVLQAGSLSAN